MSPMIGSPLAATRMPSNGVPVTLLDTDEVTRKLMAPEPGLKSGAGVANAEPTDNAVAGSVVSSELTAATAIQCARRPPIRLKRLIKLPALNLPLPGNRPRDNHS